MSIESVSFCQSRNFCKRELSCGLTRKRQATERSVTRVLTNWRGFTAAFPRRVFGNADRPEADRTSDRAGAAQE